MGSFQIPKYGEEVIDIVIKAVVVAKELGLELSGGSRIIFVFVCNIVFLRKFPWKPAIKYFVGSKYCLTRSAKAGNEEIILRIHQIRTNNSFIRFTF